MILSWLIEHLRPHPAPAPVNDPDRVAEAEKRISDLERRTAAAADALTRRHAQNHWTEAVQRITGTRGD